MLEIIFQIATLFGVGALIGLLFGLLGLLLQHATIKSYATPIINELGENKKLREILASVKTTFLAKLIIEAKKSYYKKYDSWLAEQGYYEYDLNNIEKALSEEDYKKAIYALMRMYKEPAREKKFTSDLLKGEVSITEEEIEFIDRYLRGVRFVDKMFELYSKALDFKSKFEYSYVMIVLLVLLGAISTVLRIDVVMIILLEGFITLYYLQNVLTGWKELDWAKKHIFALKGKNKVEEVIRYVLEQA